MESTGESTYERKPGRRYSARRLNTLAAGMPQCTTYLEIGVAYGQTLMDVEVPLRWGVDPGPRFAVDPLPEGLTFANQTSDDFFAQLDPDLKFDLAFLDGLHTWKQTYVDLRNTLDHVEPHSLILIDDVLPCDEYSAMDDQDESLKARRKAGLPGSPWHGDVYKVIMAIRDYHPELRYRVIDGRRGNPQALVWQRRGDEPSRPPISTVLADYGSIGYHDVFVDDVPPEWFHMAREVHALRRALAASNAAAPD